MIVDNLKEILENLEVFQTCLKTYDCQGFKFHEGFTNCIPLILFKKYSQILSKRLYLYQIESLQPRNKEEFLVNKETKNYISLEKLVQLKNL